MEKLATFQIQNLRVRIDYKDISSLVSPAEYRIRIDDASAYDAAAEFIRRSGVDLVSLQHEFGIFGGDDGTHVLRLLRGVLCPIVVTLHTISSVLTPARSSVLREIASMSRAVVVLTEIDHDVAVNELGIASAKLKLIRHGVPDVPFIRPEATAIRRSLNAPLVFVTAGHVKQEKGYHLALHALAELKKRGTRFLYLIVGRQQAQFRECRGSVSSIRALTEVLDLEKEVVFINRYLSTPTFIEHILAADIGLVMYDREEHNSSGIIPFLLGCGRIVVATGFQYAKSVATLVDGVRLAALGNHESVLTQITEIISDRKAMRKIMRRNHITVRPWLWGRVAEQYQAVFKEVLHITEVRSRPQIQKKAIYRRRVPNTRMPLTV